MSATFGEYHFEQVLARQEQAFQEIDLYTAFSDSSDYSSSMDPCDSSSHRDLPTSRSSDNSMYSVEDYARKSSSSVSESLSLSRLRRSKPFLVSYDSNMTVATRDPSGRDRCNDVRVSQVSSVDPDRLTERPKREPLFQYIDWDGNVIPSRVSGPPPVSFDRYVRNNSRRTVATTNVVVDSVTGKKVGPNQVDAANDKQSCHRGRAENTSDHHNGASTSCGATQALDSQSPDMRKQEMRKEGEVSCSLRSATPSAAAIYIKAPHSLLLGNKMGSSNHVYARTSNHQRNVSDSTTDYTASVDTDELPQVTEPRMNAFYAQYFSPPSPEINSATVPLTHEPDTSTQRHSFIAQHDPRPLRLFPPQVNKPLPLLPTPRGNLVAAQDWAVKVAAELGDLPAPCTAVRSSFSEPEDDSEDSDVEVREIDPDMFGRAKYRHMREDMPGWSEYRQQMLEESKGKPRLRTSEIGTSDKETSEKGASEKGTGKWKDLFGSWRRRRQSAMR